MKTKIYGMHDEKTIDQLNNCMLVGDVVGGVLCADGHYGYSQPVGGVVAYRNAVSVSGVGYDIGCGNKAVRTNIKFSDIKPTLSAIMDKIASSLSFGMGLNNAEMVDHELFYSDAWNVYKQFDRSIHASMMATARNQLGTVGGGNHYVDLLVDESTDELWVANHFGSRGFGHKTASGFLNVAANREFAGKPPGEKQDQPPTVLELNSELGAMYMEVMELAGQYAYAGRNYVINKVLEILGAVEVFSVHNHHNYAWKEIHNGEELVVVRKGATPSAPGQQGFIGGSMCDISVIVEGLESTENAEGFYSTVHGAGRIMSRTAAAGKINYKLKDRPRTGGLITQAMMDEDVKNYGIQLRGAEPDESSFVYRKLSEVLAAHEGTLKIKHTLRPVGVCMAGAGVVDPYKD